MSKIKTQGDRVRLQEAVQRFEQLVQNIPDGIYEAVFDAEGQMVFTYASPRLCELLDIDGKALLDDPSLAFSSVHPDDLEDLVQANERARQNLTPLRWEGRIVVRGDVRWIRISSAPTPQINGSSVWDGVVSDVTVNRQTEKVLTEIDARFHSLFNGATDGIIIAEVDNRQFVDVNPKICDMLGYSREELLKLGVDKIHPEAEMPRVLEGFERQARGEIVVVEQPVLRKDGTVFPADVSVAHIEIDDKHYLAGFFRDITERKAAESALQNSQKRLETVLNTASDGIHVLDDQGNVVLCSQSFADMLGYSHDEAMQLNVADWDAAIPKDELQKIIRSLLFKQATFETRHRRKDGSIYDAEISANGIEMDGNKYIYASSRDITERKIAEAELRHHQQRLLQAEKIAHIGSWELDSINDKLTWSDEIFRIFEVDPNKFEASYEGFLNAIHPEDRELVNSAYLYSADSREPYDITHRLLMDDGRIKWVREQGQTFYDEARPIRSVGTVQDITEVKMADEAVKRLSDRLTLAVESAGIGIWDWDVNNDHLLWDSGMYKLYGREEYDSVSAYQSWKEGLHPDDLERTEKAIQKALQGESTFNTEFRILWPDGTLRYLKASAVVQRAPNGNPTRMIGVNHDITERKEYENALQEGLETYQAAINTPVLGFCTTDAQGRLLEVNDAYVRLSGYSRGELLQMHIPDLENRETSEDVQARVERIIAVGHDRFRTEQRRKDGSIWPVEVVASFSPIQGGRLFVFIEDLTDKIEQERRLELSARVFETMDQAVIVTNAANEIISINPAATRITGYSLEEVRGKDPKVFASGRHDREFYQTMWESLISTGHWEGEIWDRRKDGKVYPKLLNINTIYDAKGNVDQRVSVFSDITERKKTEELIWRQANYDALTELANRILFQSRLQQELSQRSREGGKLGVVYLDLDGFKDVNDTLGHAAGDNLLIEVARRLEECARKTDLVARLGGDEFTLLVTEFQQPEQIGSLAERILEVLKKPIRLKENEVHIGASIGIALYPEDGDTYEELAKNADVAMYQAKASGKNHFQFFRQEMNAKAVNRLSLIHYLHKAVNDQVFQLYYQPKIRLADGKVIGMEALIRWPKDDGQMIPPADFIPYAEETGLIIPLGAWVLSEACKQTHEWNQCFGTDLKVAVNLSARQFRVKNLVSDVLSVLKTEGLPADLLELEITESILMEDVEDAIQVMKDIKEKGISIAIDDFGTGYSSLNYLKRFPITTLKIDRSFVGDLTVESEDAAIVASTIILAKSLGLEVVAEGVESQEQLDFLQEQQCDSAQGFYISKPLSPYDFAEFLKEKTQS